jgi:membrane fusion protein (multidrug efflux system)
MLLVVILVSAYIVLKYILRADNGNPAANTSQRDESAARDMSIVKQLLVLIMLSAAAYGGYAGYGHWKASIAATSPDAGKPAGGKRREGGRTTSVETAKAETRTLSRTVEAVGNTRAVRYVDIKSKADGTITEIRYKSGSRVEKGAVLFTLDDAIEKADLAQAEAEFLKADLALKRGDKLSLSRITARASVDELQAAMAAASAQVDRARARLADRTISAPFAGTPGFHAVDAGARVTKDTVLTRLDDLSSVLLEFAVPEEYFAIARVGLHAKATTAAYPDRVFDAQITQVDTMVDPVNRSFRVRAEIDNSDGALPSGMFMQLTLELDNQAMVMVPEESVTVEGDSTHVFVVADGKANKQMVKTGVREPGFVQIVSGLSDGDVIITHGTSKVRPGGAVKVVNAANKGEIQ